MLAHVNFSHKQLLNKKAPDMHEMLHQKGINWADLDSYKKNGTIWKGGEIEPAPFSTEEWWKLAQPLTIIKEE
jgi:uncharacterized circularly permuted ATP-grasp superfamily protein